MVEWDFFQKRRNVDLSVWIIELKIENYEQLKDICASKGVQPPPFATFQAAQSVALPVVGDPMEESVQEEETKSIEPKPKRRRNSRKKVSK